MEERLAPQQQAVPLGARHFAGLFLLSAATLLLELSLTRILSVQLWYHFGFLVVSTALLGFGAAGALLSASPRLRETKRLDGALSLLASALAAAIGLAWITTRKLPFDPFSLLGDARQFLFGPLFELLWALPFFAAGLAIALLLSRAGPQVNRLYGADLCGAALGCALLPLVMPQVGGPGSLAVCAALALAAAALFAGPARTRVLLAALAAASLGLAPLVERALPVQVTTNKRPPQNPLWQRWNTLSFVQVVEVPEEPGGAPAERSLIIDGGTAATGMWDLRRGLDHHFAHTRGRDEVDTGIAWPLKQAPRVLVIGSGGGGDLLTALRDGSQRAVGVEVNPLIVEVGRSVMKEWWGGLFDRPEVELVEDEARSYVRRSSERFDAIVSTHTISNAAVASGALGLAENFVLTREAFVDWLGHLAPSGILYFTRPEAQLLRLTATVREAFDATGREHPERSVLIFRRPMTPAMRARFGERGTFVAGLLAKDGPFTEEEVREINRRLRVGDRSYSGRMLGPTEILYSPFSPGFDPRYEEVLTTRDLPAFYRSNTSAIEPVTDDRPFFNQHVRWSSLGLAALRDVLGQGRGARMALEDRPVVEVTLLFLLAQTTLLAALLLLWPLRRFSRTGLPLSRTLPVMAYFAALGLGFIFVELALLQRYTLYLGQPVVALTVVLAALLLSSGLGSILSARFADARAALLKAIPLLLVVLAATSFGTRALLASTLGLPFAARCALACLSLFPLGLLLGVPFSTGLRAIQPEGPALAAWAWGVNGFATVLGTVLAILCGMTLGFDRTLLLAGAVYLAGLFAFGASRTGRGAGPAA
jgi:SAM-dependent methyltransferase